ncbi:achaete-scute complex T4 [Brachionus plicatilis]|uniref:Achaete-scute complex T4 n=1 Tax=Brachionus plicatilis TaxID=10195 RepID=A0A3M7PIF8_BRAPC|nr:achaete-scute complex T4 [Brachionus plicatilis]
MLNQQSEQYFYPRPNNFGYFEEVPRNRGGRKQVKQGTTKRNARERNRVKFINNCFEVLREHIPYELFVDENKPCGNQRKLSKVETLKYASLYIKQLTELLQQTNNQNYQEVLNEDSSNKRAKTQIQVNPYEYQYFSCIGNNHEMGYNQFSSGISSMGSNEYMYSPTKNICRMTYLLFNYFNLYEQILGCLIKLENYVKIVELNFTFDLVL